MGDLPTWDRDNFTKINHDSSHRNSTGKKTAYVPTKDIPSDQVIVTEKTNILLRYLHQQWDKKAGAKKRTGELLGEDLTGTVTKKARLETIPDTSNTTTASGTTAGRPAGGEGLVAGGNSAGASQEPPPAYPTATSSSHQSANRFANQQ